MMGQNVRRDETRYRHLWAYAVGEIAGVDVKAAYMPKKFGPTLEAVALGEVVAEGVIEFEIRSTVVGEGFTLPVNRRTVVRATRVARSPLELKNKAP